MDSAGRRDFIALSSLAAAGAVAGCATQKRAAWRPADEKAFIKAALMHLGSNMWCDVFTPIQGDKPPEKRWSGVPGSRDYLRTQEDVWRDCIDAMKKNGFNMVVIDLGEALAYPSHPELAVKGACADEADSRVHRVPVDDV